MKYAPSLSRRLLIPLLLVGAILLALPVFDAGTAARAQQVIGLDQSIQPSQAPVAQQGQMTQDERTLWGLLKSGGWCMFPLGAFSIAVVALCIYNIMELRPSHFYPTDLVVFLKERMHYCQIQQAYDTARENPSYLGQMFSHGLSFVDVQDSETMGRERVLDAMQTYANKANRKYMLWVNYFSILAQASPMLGLLGTVSGMIKAFANIGQQGMGNPTELAGNISEALVTTATGLTIAIPALFCFFVFRNRLSQMVSQAQDIAEDLLTELMTAVDPDLRPQELPEGK